MLWTICGCPYWGSASSGSSPTFQPCTPHPEAQGWVPNWQWSHVEMWLWAQYRRFEQEILLLDFWLLFPHVTSLFLITLTHISYASISLLSCKGCGSVILEDCLMYHPQLPFSWQVGCMASEKYKMCSFLSLVYSRMSVAFVSWKWEL